MPNRRNDRKAELPLQQISALPDAVKGIMLGIVYAGKTVLQTRAASTFVSRTVRATEHTSATG
jgi:hypothetical protein